MSSISGAWTLHRLIYSSLHRLAPGDEDDQLAAIVRSSIANNRAVSITGLLLFHKGYFVQALEGPAEAVLTTFGRICSDPRHVSTRTIHSGPAPSREFGDWNMCARRITPADDAILATLSLRARFDPSRLNARTALKLLVAVRAIQDRTQIAALG